MISREETEGSELSAIGNFSPFGQRVLLTCRKCGESGKYNVGRICIDPSELGGTAEQKRNAISFSGIFYCKHCGSGFPWEIPEPTLTKILTVAVSQLSRRTSPVVDPNARVHLARPVGFDGSHYQCGAEGVAYLKSKIAADPTNTFLWGRLANMYDNNDMRTEARPHYERVLEINPHEIEAHYSLGCYDMDDERPDSAAQHFRAVMNHACEAQDVRPSLLEDYLQDSIERLADLSDETNGRIPFPPPETLQRFTPPSQAVALRFASDSPDVIDDLFEICLLGRIPERMLRPMPRVGWRAARPQAMEFVSRSPVGRNDPCPCGSGKKFKKCCARDS